jgi:hypothetical protein
MIRVVSCLCKNNHHLVSAVYEPSNSQKLNDEFIEMLLAPLKQSLVNSKCPICKCPLADGIKIEHSKESFATEREASKQICKRIVLERSAFIHRN